MRAQHPQAEVGRPPALVGAGRPAAFAAAQGRAHTHRALRLPRADA
jgi:hypothetical protein